MPQATTCFKQAAGVLINTTDLADKQATDNGYKTGKQECTSGSASKNSLEKVVLKLKNIILYDPQATASKLWTIFFLILYI